MWDATMNGFLGGIGVLLVLWGCNKLVTWIERGVKREKGVTGYEVHESFQQRQARRLSKARGNA